MGLEFQQALHLGYVSTPGDVELVKEEDSIGIAIVIATNSRPPVNGTQFTTLNVPFVSFCAALGIIETFVTIGPVRNAFSLKQPLRTDHQHAFTWSGVLKDNSSHPTHVGSLVRCGLEIHTEPLCGQLGNVNYLKIVVTRLRYFSVDTPRNETRDAVNVGSGV